MCKANDGLARHARNQTTSNFLAGIVFLNFAKKYGRNLMPDNCQTKRLSDWLDVIMYSIMNNNNCLVKIDSGNGLERHRFLCNGVPIHKANLFQREINNLTKQFTEDLIQHEPSPGWPGLHQDPTPLVRLATVL